MSFIINRFVTREFKSTYRVLPFVVVVGPNEIGAAAHNFNTPSFTHVAEWRMPQNTRYLNTKHQTLTPLCIPIATNIITIIVRIIIIIISKKAFLSSFVDNIKLYF